MNKQMTQQMKKSIGMITVGVLLAASSAFAAPLGAGTYKVDGAHSKVGFEISHMVISTVEGRFDKYDATVTAGAKFEDLKIDAAVEIGSIDTGEKKRDDHLKSPDFFDAAKFPKMTFKSTKVSGAPESFKLEGDLTIKGVTKKVTFDAKYLGTANDPWGNTRAAFSATTKINRKDFGLTWNKMIEAGPLVGDEVTISLKVEGVKEVPKAKGAKK